MTDLERLILFLDENKDCMKWHERLKYPFWKWAARKVDSYRNKTSQEDFL